MPGLNRVGRSGCCSRRKLVCHFGVFEEKVKETNACPSQRSEEVGLIRMQSSKNMHANAPCRMYKQLLCLAAGSSSCIASAVRRTSSSGLQDQMQHKADLQPGSKPHKQMISRIEDSRHQSMSLGKFAKTSMFQLDLKGLPHQLPEIESEVESEERLDAGVLDAVTPRVKQVPFAFPLQAACRCVCVSRSNSC